MKSLPVRRLFPKGHHCLAVCLSSVLLGAPLLSSAAHAQDDDMPDGDVDLRQKPSPPPARPQQPPRADPKPKAAPKPKPKPAPTDDDDILTTPEPRKPQGGKDEDLDLNDVLVSEDEEEEEDEPVAEEPPGRVRSGEGDEPPPRPKRTRGTIDDDDAGEVDEGRRPLRSVGSRMSRLDETGLQPEDEEGLSTGWIIAGVTGATVVLLAGGGLATLLLIDAVTPPTGSVTVEPR